MLFRGVFIDMGIRRKNYAHLDKSFQDVATCVTNCFSRYLKFIGLKSDVLGHLTVEIVYGKEHMTQRRKWNLEDWNHYLEYELDFAELEKVGVFEFFVDFVEEILIEFIGENHSQVNEVASLACRIKRDRELFRIPFRSVNHKMLRIDLFLLAREGIEDYYQMFMEVTWKETGVTRTYFVLEDYYQCMVALVSRISLKGDIISFVPGKSDNARHHQRDFVKRGFDVPVTVDLSTKKPYRF